MGPLVRNPSANPLPLTTKRSFCFFIWNCSKMLSFSFTFLLSMMREIPMVRVFRGTSSFCIEAKSLLPRVFWISFPINESWSRRKKLNPNPPDFLLPGIKITSSFLKNPYSLKASSGMVITPSWETPDHPKTCFPPLTSWGTISPNWI